MFLVSLIIRVATVYSRIYHTKCSINGNLSQAAESSDEGFPSCQHFVSHRSLCAFFILSLKEYKNVPPWKLATNGVVDILVWALVPSQWERGAKPRILQYV